MYDLKTNYFNQKNYGHLAAARGTFRNKLHGREPFINVASSLCICFENISCFFCVHDLEQSRIVGSRPKTFQWLYQFSLDGLELCVAVEVYNSPWCRSVCERTFSTLDCDLLMCGVPPPCPGKCFSFFGKAVDGSLPMGNSAWFPDCSGK